LGLAGFDRIGLCCSRRSISSIKSGRSRDRSRSKRAIIIISIVHSQFLLTIYDVMECCLVASFLCSHTQGHFNGERSLPSICFRRVMSASSSMAGAGARQMFDLPTMYLYTCTVCGTEFMRAEKIRKNTLETFSMDDRIKVIRYSLLKASSKRNTNLFESFSELPRFFWWS